MASCHVSVGLAPAYLWYTVKSKPKYTLSAFSMNLFRLCGDMIHLLSILLLLWKLQKSKSCVGEWLDEPLMQAFRARCRRST